MAPLRVGCEHTLAYYKIGHGENITPFWAMTFMWWPLNVRGF
jgi:hypothetical protein